MHISERGRDLILAEMIELARLGRFNDNEVAKATDIAGRYKDAELPDDLLGLEWSVTTLYAEAAARRGEQGLAEVYRRKAKYLLAIIRRVRKEDFVARLDTILQRI